jgi:hypothetical protein
MSTRPNPPHLFEDDDGRVYIAFTDTYRVHDVEHSILVRLDVTKSFDRIATERAATRSSAFSPE